MNTRIAGLAHAVMHPRSRPCSWVPGSGFAGPGMTNLSLIPERQTVLARLRAPDQHAALPIHPDRLATADRHLEHLDLVAALGEVGAHRLGHEMLGLQHALIGEDARCGGRLRRAHAALE